GCAGGHGVERGGGDAWPLQVECIGGAIELAVDTLKGGRAHDLFAHRVVAGRDPEPGGFAVEGGIVDETREYHAVDAVLAGFGHGQAAAELTGDLIEFLTHRAAEVVNLDPAVTDPGDIATGEAAADADPEPGEPDD